MEREIVLFEEHFKEFYSKQSKRTQIKMDAVIELVGKERRVPARFLKYLKGSDGIYEIRVRTTDASVRICCCFHQNNLVVLLSGFVKKTKKTPRREIRKAERLKAKYLRERHD